VLDEEPVRFELVGHAGTHVCLGKQQERRGELVSRAGEHRMVEIVQRHDEANVVLTDERSERHHVSGICDPRDDGVTIGVIKRRREWISVGAERNGSGGPERLDDVDALARAGEQDHHERREYSEDFAATPLT